MFKAAILLASGEGSRFGGDIPKQYVDLQGKPIILHSLEKLKLLVEEIIVVINNKHEHFFRSISNNAYVFGGARRQDSVYAGLKALSSKNPDYVLIHDAARPMVSEQIIASVIQELAKYKAVDVGISVQDTIKQKQPKLTLDRSNLYLTQTPQGFDFSTILELYERYNHKDYTDDISMAIEVGVEVGFVQGDKKNIKITTPEDLLFCKSLSRSQVRRP